MVLYALVLLNSSLNGSSNRFELEIEWFYKMYEFVNHLNLRNEMTVVKLVLAWTLRIFRWKIIMIIFSCTLINIDFSCCCESYQSEIYRRSWHWRMADIYYINFNQDMDFFFLSFFLFAHKRPEYKYLTNTKDDFVMYAYIFRIQSFIFICKMWKHSIHGFHTLLKLNFTKNFRTNFWICYIFFEEKKRPDASHVKKVYPKHENPIWWVMNFELMK